MNFSSHCIDENNELIKKLLKFHLNEDAEKLALINASIESSQKFILPCPDQLNINVNYDSLILMKMPYPVMSLEYTIIPRTEEEIINNKKSLMKRAFLDCNETTTHHLKGKSLYHT